MTGRALAVGTVAELELRQRVRSTAWYVLLGIAAAVLAAITVLLLATASAFGSSGGNQVLAVVVYLVLLLGSLVTPALSGAAVNGDRDAGTLATTQVTLVSTWQLLLGKLLAAWTASLAFLAIAAPFLLVAVVVGRVPLPTVLVALLVTVVELGVVAAIGVGLSSVMARPVFSVATTYLVVATLSLGTLIAFGLAGLAFPRTVTTTYRPLSQATVEAQGRGEEVVPVCDSPQISTRQDPTWDRVWGLLAANPYAVLADAVPARFDGSGNPADAFSATKAVLRSVQIPRPTTERIDDCGTAFGLDSTPSGWTPEETVARTVPSWFVGLAIHLVLAAGALVLGARALRTPARRLARGSRIA